MGRPDLGYGMRHVAIFVEDLAACEHFYIDLIGMQLEWRPDENNVFLSSGSDNLALHKGHSKHKDNEPNQRLDHIGFFLKTANEVDTWFEWLKSHNIKMRTEPKTHRDGARSFYCYDPDGTLVQIIHHPPICEWENNKA